MNVSLAASENGDSAQPPARNLIRSAALVAVLAFAFISILSAVFPLTDWSELARLTLIYYVVLLAGGVVLLGGGLFAVFSRRRLKLALIVCGAASLGLLANQVAGLHLQCILCHTPS